MPILNDGWNTAATEESEASNRVGRAGTGQSSGSRALDSSRAFGSGVRHAERLTSSPSERTEPVLTFSLAGLMRLDEDIQEDVSLVNFMLNAESFGVVKLADLTSHDQDAPVTMAVKQLHSNDSSDVRFRVALVSVFICCTGGRLTLVSRNSFVK